MSELTKVINEINDGLLLNKAMFTGVDLDSVLDQRDEDEFDRQWQSVYKAVEASFNASDFENEEIELLEAIRKEFFWQLV